MEAYTARIVNTAITCTRWEKEVYRDTSLKLNAGRNILALQPLRWWLQAMPIRLLLVLP